MQRIPGNSQQPSINPNHRRLQPVASLPIIDREHTQLISKQVLIVVRNMMDSAIFLKRGAHVAHVASAMMVPPEEAPLEKTRCTSTKRMTVCTKEAGETVG